VIVPNAENAEVEIRKLTEYLLNHEHADGRHKARIYAAALDFYAKDAEDLKRARLIAVKANEAVFGRFDKYGQRYTVDFLFEWGGKRAIIRSGWIIEHGSDIPRLTTAFPI
jgi:hypothetical protein